VTEGLSEEQRREILDSIELVIGGGTDSYDEGEVLRVVAEESWGSDAWRPPRPPPPGEAIR